jgi:hypothetical protein
MIEAGAWLFLEIFFWLFLIFAAIGIFIEAVFLLLKKLGIK